MLSILRNISIDTVTGALMEKGIRFIGNGQVSVFNAFYIHLLYYVDTQTS